MLVHACWQGALVAAVLRALLRLLQAPSARYAASCVALAVLVVAPVATTLTVHMPASQSPAMAMPDAFLVDRGGANLGGTATASPVAWTDVQTWDDAAAWMLQPWLPGIVGLWALGLLAAVARLVGGALRVRRLRRESRPAPALWADRMERLAEQMGLGQAVPLRVSGAVSSPMVVGWMRPLVLVPTGMLTGLPPNQVEALLLHELAHVRRHDVLVGWMQAAVETLLFFHPATWWISAQIRRERELCCDDRAVSTGADTLTYAEALTSVAEQQVRPTLALAASDGPLLQRVRRLLAPAPSPAGWTQRLSLGAVVAVLAVLPIVVAACASQEGTTTPSAEPTPAVSSDSAAPVDTSARRVVVTDDEDETVLRVERDSGRVTVDRMRTEGDSDDTLFARFRVPQAPFPPDSLPDVVMPSFPDRPPVPFADTIRGPDVDGWFRFPVPPDDDSLRRSLEDDMERLREWKERWQQKWEAEGTEEREELERRLRQWREEHADSLERRAEDWAEGFGRWSETFENEWRFGENEDWERRMRRFEQQADSARAHAERLRERLTSEHWERKLRRLREQAERLREHAERLDERARDMEERLPPNSPR